MGSIVKAWRTLLAALVVVGVLSACDAADVAVSTSVPAGSSTPAPVTTETGDLGAEPSSLCAELPEDAPDDHGATTVDDLNRLIAEGAEGKEIRTAAAAIIGSDFAQAWRHRVDGELRWVIAAAGDPSVLAGLNGADAVRVEFSEAELRCFEAVFFERIDAAVQLLDPNPPRDDGQAGVRAIASASKDWKENRLRLGTSADIAARLDLTGIPEAAYVLEISLAPFAQP